MYSEMSPSFDPQTPASPVTTHQSNLDNKSKKTYDIAVIGGGIAGICTAERLSRNGQKVVLVERNESLAMETSAEQHGWGQFGHLYLGAPDPHVAETCLQNVELIQKDYSLEGNNIKFEENKVDSPNLYPEKNELVSSNVDPKKSWYREDKIFYYYPDPDEKTLNLNTEENKNWEDTLGNIYHRTYKIANHNWGRDSTEGLLNTPSAKENKTYYDAKKVCRQWMSHTAKKNPNGPIGRKLKSHQVIKGDLNQHTVIESHDRPMFASNIMRDLVGNFQNNGGTVLTKTNIKDYKIDNDQIDLTTQDGDHIYADKAIFTSGDGLANMSNINPSVVLSPILVVTPAICDRNIVKLTPKKEFTINHMHHVDPSTQKTYSLIGNGDAIKPDDKEGIEASRENLVKLAKDTFPNFDPKNQESFIYFGTKVEIPATGSTRNYHFVTKEVKKGKVWAAVPGKFTLAFSLSRKIASEISPEDAGNKSSKKEESSDVLCLSPTLPQQIVSKNIINPELYSKRSHLKGVVEK